MKRALVRALVWGFLLGFLTWTTCVSITPLREWTQEVGACRGAERIERDVRDGGDVRSNGRSVGTTVFTLRCTYAEDDVRLVENDEAVLKGFAAAFLIGFVPGALIGVGRTALSRARAGTPPAPARSPGGPRPGA